MTTHSLILLSLLLSTVRAIQIKPSSALLGHVRRDNSTSDTTQLIRNVYLASAQDYKCLSPTNATIDVSTLSPNRTDPKDLVAGAYVQSLQVGKRQTNDSTLSNETEVSVGTIVSGVDCRSALSWDLYYDQAGLITLSGTDLVLDANDTDNGVIFVNNATNATTQTWYWTRDDHIAIFSGERCLDSGEDGQVYRCYGNNIAQTWIVGDLDHVLQAAGLVGLNGNPACAGIPLGQNMNDTLDGNVRIHPCGRQDLCVSSLDCTLTDGNATECSSIGVTYCVDVSDPNAGLQFWYMTPQLIGTPWSLLNNLNTSAEELAQCLTARDAPADGGNLTLGSCVSATSGSTWGYDTKTMQLSTSNGQCLDVKADSGERDSQPWKSLMDLQTWTCSAIDPHQQFFVP